MYLKRLELHGFKSFASPTTLEFGTGVTCIAGPNGAGKTNVAESIRWVLGEQASRVIRAKKTEDVIFSGSAKRSPLGLAEVRITLDNADGWLPLEFDEVVVSRQAHRSGESEYYLNQSRVRLRDITQLFLKAQVGQNSYAFMGQGLVEQVLTLRPEERRGLIEEAAEVRLHREKLDESRNRLRATQDNLERVQLIVNEIEPRLRQLERQADRAASHARLSAELAGALQTLFGQQWQEAQEALADARAACDQRQEEFDRAKQDIATHEEGLEALATAIEERRRDIASREQAYQNLEDYRRDLQQRLKIDEDRVRALTLRGEDLTSEIGVLSAEKEDQATLAAHQNERAISIEEALDDARSPDADSRRLDAIDARLAELRKELTETDHQAAAVASSQAEAEGRLSALTAQRERLQADLASLERTRDEQKALLKTWAREFANRRERWAQLSPEVQRAARTLAETQARLEKAEADARQREDEVRRLSAEVQSAEARLEAAQSTEIELPMPDAGVKALMAAGGRLSDEESPTDARIHGLVGLIGELLRVPEGLERAIEAALADSLHAIVVETQEDALAASELLTSEDLGRAVIFPLSDIRLAHPINLIEERGVVGVAAQLVRCESRYRPLVNVLLGRTIVAQNLGIAKMLLRRGLGSVVTLDGILLHPSGSISAGGAKVVRRAIAHQRDVGELPSELERLHKAHEEGAAALETSRQTLNEAKQSRERLAPELERMQRELRATEDALREHRGRLPTAAARLTALDAQQREALRAVSETDTDLDAARERVQQARGQAQEFESTRERLLGESREQTMAREAVVKSMETRTTRIATLETEQQSLERQRAMHGASEARTGEGLARRVELAAGVEQELETVRGRMETTGQELDAKSQEAEAANEELGPARHSLEQMETRRRAMNDELATARSDSLSAERAHLEAESSVRLRTEELESLRERLAEEGFQPSEEGAVEAATAEGEQPPAWLTAESGARRDEPPPMRGGSGIDTAVLKESIQELRGGIRKLGPVNEQAGEDFTESRERYEFLTGQLTDLNEAEASLQEAIEELERIIKERFSTTFQQVNTEFQRYFETFFQGGHGELVLTKPDERGLPGVDIIAQPPRKRVRSINMLSGGERALTALALLFALLDTHPSPICVLDEVDAALDEANVDRFTAALSDLAKRTQFIIITHNRRTLEMADTIYGIAMGADSTSSVLSLKLSEVPDAEE